MTVAAMNHKSTTSRKSPIKRKRGVYIEAAPKPVKGAAFFEDLDAAYRALCAILFNFASSGHPGGSVSASRIMAGLMFERMNYDFADPDAPHADQICFTAGHKAMGLYAMWAIRNEMVRLARPRLLPRPARQLRIEDLLGFRRNPTQDTPMFRRLKAKALDGHPTPMTPFVPFATGPSGVGVGAGVGLALGARDAYGKNAPQVHMVEGECGMTPGRVHEAIAAAATMGLDNLTLHIDWNQSSIDSDRVCPWDGQPGDYVQWDPVELMHVHDWNVVYVGDGHDPAAAFSAQRTAGWIKNGQPTAIVYRTVKGWHYGIEGAKSHGAGHGYCSPEFYESVADFEERFGARLPRFLGKVDPTTREQAYYRTLEAFRKILKDRPGFAKSGARRVAESAMGLRALKRKRPAGGPRLERLYKGVLKPGRTPAVLKLTPGKSETTRGAMGAVLGYLNETTDGAFIGCSADLSGSTSLIKLGKNFTQGLWHARKNPKTRMTAIGGICEDAMGAAMSGVSAFGAHIGVSSSYAAFIVPLEHIAARVHAIGQWARKAVVKKAPGRTWIMLNAHAGSMTGEDGPTHADPQPLQMLQNNFPKGTVITLTPWEPAELWPLVAAGLAARPAVLCPFVTRPAVSVPDRRKAGIPPASAAAQGVYAMRRANTPAALVIQGCGVANIFVHEVLPVLDKEKINLNVFYIASVELFELLPKAKREKIFPRKFYATSMGITDFTLPTLQRFVRSDAGLEHSLYPFRGGEFLGSGIWKKVFEEGGLHAASQLKAIRAWVRRARRI